MRNALSVICSDVPCKPGCSSVAKAMEDLDITPNIDELGSVPITVEEALAPESLMRACQGLENHEGNSYLKYAIVASIALHAILLAVLIPKLAGLASAAAMLKPGEQVTRVKLSPEAPPQPSRLVEFPDPKKEVEPPPESPSAISDRNRVARTERIPKVLPGPRPPLGRIAASPQQIASLPAPMAPEDLVSPEAEKPERKVQPKEKPPTLRKKGVKADTPQEPTPQSRRSKPLDFNPTPREMAAAFGLPGASSDFYPEGNPEEAVVDINTREDKYFSYLLHLKKKIEGVWVYPRVAASNGIGGELTAEFLINKDGSLLEASVLDSSGQQVLDQSAVSAIKAAAPYHPFPESLKAKRLRVRARFIYITQRYFRGIM